MIISTQELHVMPVSLAAELEYLLARSLTGYELWASPAREDWKAQTTGVRRLISNIRGYKNEWGYSDTAVELAQTRYKALVDWRIACGSPHSTPETRARFGMAVEQASKALARYTSLVSGDFAALAYLASSENE